MIDERQTCIEEEKNSGDSGSELGENEGEAKAEADADEEVETPGSHPVVFQQQDYAFEDSSDDDNLR